MELRQLIAYGLIALLLIGLIFTFATVWQRARISRNIADGRSTRHSSKRWPWYRG